MSLLSVVRHPVYLPLILSVQDIFSLIVVTSGKNIYCIEVIFAYVNTCKKLLRSLTMNNLRHVCGCLGIDAHL
jgi:hypothetical protein